MTYAGHSLQSASMPSKDVTVWVRIGADTARELDSVVKREKAIRRRQIDLRAMTRSTAIREAIVAYLASYRARNKPAEPDPRQAPLPGTDQ